MLLEGLQENTVDQPCVLSSDSPALISEENLTKHNLNSAF